MYDYVATINPAEKRAFFGTATATGTLTYSSATYTLTDNAGTQLATGTVTGHDAPSSLAVRVWQVIDAAGVPLPTGCSILSLVTLTTSADSVNPTLQERIILYVPGVVTRSLMPTAADLQQSLVSIGMLANPPSDTEKLLDLDSMVNAAVREWERVSGYRPFLANAADVTRVFNPPGPNEQVGRYWVQLRGGGYKLIFDNGLASLTSLYTGVSTGNAGTLRTLNTDFYLYPQNATAEGKPYQWAEFTFRLWGTQQAIHITGKWGYGATLREDAWRSILKMAQADALERLIAFRFNGLQSWTTGGTTEKYDLRLGGLIDGNRKAFYQALKSGYIREY